MAHSLTDLARALASIAVAVKVESEKALEKAAKIVEAEAKDAIGQYKDGYGWPQLAPATQADRAGKGYPPNEPLLRDGTLRDSISHYLEDDTTAYVGSPLKVALYQELGTSKIPPRSFLGGAARAKEKEIKALGVEALKTAIRSKLAP